MKSNRPTTYCSNCGHALEGVYCSYCGQKNTNKKTSWLDATGALASGLLSMERGIFATILEVIQNPKKVVEVYWSGGRYFYQSPGQMIFFVVLVLGIHLLFVDSRILGFQVQLSEVPEAYRGLLNPQLVFVALILPFTALTTRLYFFRRKRSFPEHFISAVYIFSTWAIVLTIISDLASLMVDIWPGIIVILFLALIFTWSSRVFSERPGFGRLMLNTHLQLLIFIVILVLAFALFFILGIGKTNFSLDY
jgi:hypothetical protein